MKPTSDPYVFIEEEREDYVRYQNTETGKRWEVHGKCIGLGNCLVGAVIEGFGEIKSHEDIEKAKKKLGKERIDSEMDVPVAPGFRNCCPLEVVEL